MDSGLLRKELRQLEVALRSAEEVTRVVLRAEPPGPYAELLRRRFPKARIWATVTDARQASEAKSAGVAVQVTTDLAFLGDLGENRPRLILMRVGGFEGKARLREQMEDAYRHLAEGGRLLLLTHTKRGAPSQLGLLEEVFDSARVLERGGGGVRVLEAVLTESAETGPVDDTNPPALESSELLEETVLGVRLGFRTAPSVFSRERLDHGSRLLLEILPTLDGPDRILDLGCGYGVLGIALAARYPEVTATLVDVDLRAVELAQENARRNGVGERVRVVHSDGLAALLGAGERPRFDLAVTHFPLHIARADLERILTETRRALVPGGQLWGVMLAAYELRPLVQEVFGRVETVRETDAATYPHAYAILKATAR